MTSKAKKKSGKSRLSRFGGRTSSAKKAATARTAKVPKLASKPKATRATPALAAEPLDQFIAAAAHLLELPLEPAWLPAIKANLEVTLRFSASVAAFELLDETDPAPVFGA